MMKPLLILLTAALAVTPLATDAATPHFQTGGQMECDEIREEGEMIRCKRFSDVRIGYPEENVTKIIRGGDESHRISPLLSPPKPKPPPDPPPLLIDVRPETFTPVNFRIAARHPPFSTSVTDRKPDIIRREPVYGGTQRFYGVLGLGRNREQRFGFAVDMHGPREILGVYFDRNADGDLRNDGVLRNQGTGRFAAVLKIPWRRIVPDCPYRRDFAFWFYTNEAGWQRGRFFSHYSRTQLKGSLLLGGKTFPAYLAEVGYNDGILINDGIYVDVNRDGKMDREEHFMEEITAGDYHRRFIVTW